MGLSMKWTAKVTEYEPNRKWAKNIISGPMTIEEHVSYVSLGECTKFTIVYDMNASGFLKLFSPMMARSMRKETQKSLSTLKSKLEAQT